MMNDLLRCMWVAAVLGGATAGAQSPVADTRATLEKWVETRQLTARLQSDWQADKETLEQSIKLFEKELANLSQSIAQVDTTSQQTEQERQKLEQENAALKATSEKLKTRVTELERSVQALAKSLPAPLTERLEPLLKRVPQNPAETKASVPERMQIVVGILSEVDKFNGSLSVVSELRKNPAGAEVQVKTLYLGLAQAYFVDKTGDYAGVGVPSPEGWQWTPRKDLAPRIAKAIAVYENTQPAAFVSLPLKIK